MSNDPPVVRGKSGDLDQPSNGDDVPSFRQLAAVWFKQSIQPAQPDISDKLTPEHISKSLDLVDAHDARVLKDRRDSRRFSFYAMAIAVFAIIAVIAMFVFTGNAALIEVVIDRLVFVGVGGLGGAGLAILRSSRRND